jgi:biopolymer transport protein ExbD
MRRRAIEEAEASPQINIVPMIDVIFAILTFFIMSTLTMTRFEGLAVNLPRATSTKPQPTERVMVTLDRKGDLFLNRNPLKIDSLATTLRPLRQPNVNLVVVINADGAVPHDKVVAVMDQVRQVEGAKLSIATRRPK